MDNLPDPANIDSWPGAIVAVVLICAVGIVPGLFAYLASKNTKAINTSLNTNNGGSTAKDKLDLLPGLVDQLNNVTTSLEDVHTRLGKLEAATTPDKES